MAHPKDLSSLRGKWVALLLSFWIMEAIMFPKATSLDQTGTQSPGLLCISDCTTCPVICSPPPPPMEWKPTPTPPPLPPPIHHSPPPVHHSPPWSYYFDAPPPPPQSNSYSHSPPPSPPQSYYFNSPPPSALPAPPPPPPSYVSWGGTTSPPPPSLYPNIPVDQVPPGMVKRNYSYPYYYFYASKAASLSFPASLFPLLFLFSHVMLLC